MPSYPSDVWDDDREAWDHLAKQGFTQEKGIITPPSPTPQFDYKTSEAINYLCGEWDWGYEPPKQTPRKKPSILYTLLVFAVLAALLWIVPFGIIAGVHYLVEGTW